MKKFIKYCLQQLEIALSVFLIGFCGIGIYNLIKGNTGTGVGMIAIASIVFIAFVIASIFTYNKDKKE